MSVMAYLLHLMTFAVCVHRVSTDFQESVPAAVDNNPMANLNQNDNNAQNKLLYEILQRVNILETLEERQQTIEAECRRSMQELQKDFDIQKRAVNAMEVENKRQTEEIQKLKTSLEEKESEDFESKEINESVITDVQDRPRKAADGAHVAFFAKLDSNLAHLAPNATVAFDVVEVNVGWAYDPATGYFTAPVSGVYVFSTTLTTFSVFQINCGLAVNGNRVTHLWINGADQSFGSSSQTVLLQLNGGDRVTVQQGDAEAYVDGGGHSLFTGFLLF